MRLIVVGGGWLLGLYVGSRLGVPVLALALTLAAVVALAVVLKVAPHHGSDTSSTTAFMEAVQPRLAVTSVGG